MATPTELDLINRFPNISRANNVYKKMNEEQKKEYCNNNQSNCEVFKKLNTDCPACPACPTCPTCQDCPKETVKRYEATIEDLGCPIDGKEWGGNFYPGKLASISYKSDGTDFNYVLLNKV